MISSKYLIFDRDSNYEEIEKELGCKIEIVSDK